MGTSLYLDEISNIAEWRSLASFCVELNFSTTSCKLPSPLADVLTSTHLFYHETVAKFEQIMRITLNDLCILTPGVSRSSIHRILTENLQYRKVSDIWHPVTTTCFLRWKKIWPEHAWVTNTRQIRFNCLPQLYGSELVWYGYTKSATMLTKMHRPNWRLCKKKDKCETIQNKCFFIFKKKK